VVELPTAPILNISGYHRETNEMLPLNMPLDCTPGFSYHLH